MVLDRKTSFFLGKDGFCVKNRVFPGKDGFGKESQLFPSLGKTKKKIFWETMWPKSQILFFFLP